MKGIDKVAAKVESLTKLDNQITVKLDDNAMKQLDRITKAVENLSDLGSRFQQIVTDVFDLLDGKIGNVADQIENDLGGSIKGVGDQVDDGITNFFGRMLKGLKAMSPLLLGQVLGASILIERLVKGGFQLSSLIPKIFSDARTGVGVVSQFISLFKSFSFGNLMSVVLTLSNGLLSVTTVVAILTTGLRALTQVTLNFLQRRPETSLQKFVLILETLNAGMNDLLARSRIIIERTFFISSLLGSVSALVIGIKVGVTALTGTVAPWLSLVFVGLTGIRFIAVKLQDMLLRFRAAAGDGRAQTTLFLRAIRQLFPILEALAKNAKPLAKMIAEFAKGGIDKKIKAVVGQVKDGISALNRIDGTMRNLLKLIDSMLSKVLSSLDKVIDKADELFAKIGRQGARDALASVERVRSTAVRATKDVTSEIQKLAPATAPAKKSLAELGASFFDFSRKAVNIATRGAVGAAGGILSLMLFGKSGNIVPLLDPLTLFREKATGTLDSLGRTATKTGDKVASAFSSEAFGKALSDLGKSFSTMLSTLGTKGAALGKIFWNAVTNKTTIVAAFKAASVTLGAIAPLVAVTLGVVLTPLLLKATRNIVMGTAKIAGETWQEAWPTLRERILRPLGDMIAFIPKKLTKVVVDDIPAAVNLGVAKVFKGVVSLGDKVKQFFGVIPISTEKATKKAADILSKQLEPANRLRKGLAQIEGQIRNVRTALVRAQDTKAAKGEELATDHPLAKALRRLVSKRDALTADLQDLGAFVGDVFSEEVRSKLVDKIREAQRPIRKEIFETGAESARALASGLTAAKDLIGAALVAPFSRARTVTLLRSGVGNLAKSVKATLSVAFKTAGNSAQILIAGIERIPDALGLMGRTAAKSWAIFNDGARLAANATSFTLRTGIKMATGLRSAFKALISDPGASIALALEKTGAAMENLVKGVPAFARKMAAGFKSFVQDVPGGLKKAAGSVAEFAEKAGKKFTDLFSSGGKTRRTIGGFFKAIADEGSAIAKSFQRNLGGGFVRSLLSPFALLAKGLKGFGNLLGGKGTGLTARTGGERAGAAREEASTEKQKVAADLLAVQKAEKAARDAQIKITKLSTDAEMDKVLKAEALLAQTTDNSIALGELYNTWQTLRTEADKLREEFKNTATITGRIDERFTELAGSDFDSFVELNKKIVSLVPDFDKVKQNIQSFADSIGLTQEKQESIFSAVGKAEERLKAQVEKYSTALEEVSVVTVDGVTQFRDVFQEWENQNVAIKATKAKLEEAQTAIGDVAAEMEKTAPEFKDATDAMAVMQDAVKSLSNNLVRSDRDFLSPDQLATFAQLFEKVENLGFAISVQEGILNSSLTSVKQKEAAEEKLTDLLQQKAAAQAQENALDVAATQARVAAVAADRARAAAADKEVNALLEVATEHEGLIDIIENYKLKAAEIAATLEQQQTAQETLSKTAMLVEQGMATQRGNMSSLNNAVALYTSEIERATSGIEGVTRLSDVAAQEAAGKEAALLKSREIEQAKQFLAQREEELTAAKMAINERQALIAEVGTLKELTKADAKATQKLTEAHAIYEAGLDKAASEAQKQVASVSDVGAAMQTQADIIEQKTVPALKEVAEGGSRFAAAMVRATDSVHSVDKSLREVGERKSAPEEATAESVNAKVRKVGPAVSPTEIGQLKDLFGLLIKASTPSQILNTNLSKVRESLKNNPIFKVINELDQIGDASELAFSIMEKVVHQPEKVVNDLNDGLKQLVALLVQAEESPAKKSALEAQFSPDVIKRVMLTVRTLRELQTLESKFRPGGGQKRSEVPDFGKNVLQAVAAQLKAAVESGAGLDDVADRVIATVQEKMGAAAQGMRLTEANEIFVQRINDMLSVAGGEIDATGKGMADKGLRMITGYADGVAKGTKNVTNAVDKSLRGVEGYFPKSLPKKGPLRRAMLGMAKFGSTVAQQMMKGQGAITKATEELLKPVADRMEHKSPPRTGPLAIAERSMALMGQTIGQQMMRGVGALKNLANEFLSSGFSGMAVEGLGIGKTIVGGITKGLMVPFKIADKIPVLRFFTILPSKLAQLFIKIGGVVTTGVISLAQTAIGKLGPIFKDAIDKLNGLANQSRRLNLEPDKLQKFSEAMGLLGAQSGDAENSLQQLKQSIDSVLSGQAPELAGTFAAAGLSLQDLQRMKPDEVFLRIAEAANAAGGDIKTQTELLRVVGADFSNMKGVILQGSEALATAFEKANKNPPISKAALERAGKFQTFLTQIQQTFERLKLVLFEELSPFIEQMFDNIAGDGKLSVDTVIEHVRGALRIIIKTLTLIGEFVRERYIEASDGGAQFVEDIKKLGVIVGNTLLGVGKALWNGLSRMVGPALSIIWNSISTRAQLGLKSLGIDIITGAAKWGVSLVFTLKALGVTILDFMKRLALVGWESVKGIILTGVKSLGAGIRAVLGEEFSDFIGLPDFEDAVNEVADSASEMGKILTNTDLEGFFKRINADTKEYNNTLDLMNADLKETSSRAIALEEVAAALRAIGETADASDRVARLREMLAEVNKTSVEDLAQFTETELKEALKNAAKHGFIAPGTFQEGKERLRTEAIAAFSTISDEMGNALSTAFKTGIESLKKDTPEFFALLEKIGITTQEELEATAARIAQMRAEGKLTAKAMEEILSGADRLKSSIQANAAMFLKLRIEATGFIEEFGSKMGILLPALQRDAEFVEKSFVQMRSELEVMASRDPALLAAMAKRLGIQEASVDAIVEELQRREEVSAELAKQKQILEQMQQGMSLRQQFEDMGAAVRGPFSEAARQIENIRGQMEQTINSLREQFEQLSDEQIRAFATGLGIDTASMTGDEIKAAIEASVSEGFENGMNVAAGRPWGELFKNNLFEPLFAGFKDTIKGLVDGSLMEAARAAEEIAEVSGQKFSKVLFVIADFGKKIFDTMFDKLLDQTFTLLTETLTKSITESFTSDAAEGAAGNLGDVAGGAIGAAITAALALGGLLLSRLQSEIKATKEAVDDIVESSEAIRGVISGSTTVAIKEAEDAFRDAQKPITVRLDTIIGLMRSALGGASIPSIPLGAAGSTTLGP